MEFKYNLWDITKSVAVVVILLFIWINGQAIINNFNHDAELPPEIITQIKDNQIIIENLRASNDQANALIKQLMVEKGQAAELLEYVKDTNKKKDAHIEELAATVATMVRSVEKIKSSSDVAKTPAKTGDDVEDARRDKLAYEMKKIYYTDTDGKKFPVAWAMYFPNQDPDKKWKTGTYELEFHQTIIESENKNGTYDRAVEFHIENNRQDETKGKEFPIKLTDVKWEKYELKEKSFRWWNPRLGIGFTSTNINIVPTLNISLMSYGKTDVDMDWRFLTFGIGANNISDNDSLIFLGSFEPFSWNVGKALPLVKNLFVGPAVTFDSESNIGYGLSLSVPF